jgi:leucine-rich repeat protein SHOC2
LSGQNLTKTPSYVFVKYDTEELDLSNNNLSGALQAEIRNLTRLKVLDLSNNDFTGLPAEIGQLKNLEVLDISNNQITGLPHELGNLQKLKLLDLSGNNYSKQDLEKIKETLPSSAVIKTE